MMQKDSPFSHLRPTTTPEMLDRALMVAIRFSPVLWMASLVYAADHLLPLFAGNLPEGEATTPTIAITVLALMLLGEFASAIGYLALFQGMLFPLRPISPKALLRTGLKKLAGYFITHLLYMTAMAMTAMTAYGLFTAGDKPGDTSIKWVEGALAGLVTLWVGIRLCLAPVAALIEDCSPFKAFGRSWHLTAVRRGAGPGTTEIPPLRWLAIIAVPAAVALALAGGVALYAYSQLGLQWPVNWKSEQAAWALNFFFFLTLFLVSPLYWAGLMALYVEYRMRYEALDFYLRLRERRRIMAENPASDPAKSH